jgi:hypothetical protein
MTGAQTGLSRATSLIVLFAITPARPVSCNEWALSARSLPPWRSPAGLSLQR